MLGQPVERPLATVLRLAMWMWIFELIDILLLGQGLNALGIRPRTPLGLIGIPLCPFLHGNLSHLIANTIPFVSLGWLVTVRRPKDFWAVTVLVTIVSGLGIWIFGRAGSVHIGASGVVFGYLGFLLLRGYFERSAGAMFLSILVGVLYGGMLWGVLPIRDGVSWEGHLFGFIGGILAARLLADDRRTR
ncbi:MAG: rhomboid family intramembrane serine protease [Deltaproteobacteria bacterium]|nr:rhomboid family intramembrane serine protease [Deltaproteobacteria bacterium]MCB9479475.1 rhomboid family intramembrane serine protease [Deltaproteobacteria bacterium]MCB9489642.1 rhomboid family intramembrane serine protease [Deltaproteobacteria bacterium]